MAKFDDFELDLKVNIDKDNTVKPNLTSVALCTPGCSYTMTYGSACCVVQKRTSH
ncbi:gallidermin/nisin family lantibiotic [Clostridium sp. JS66]|uniref:gallidermin/nisin family lantibiotic n=1 Tax=Clostridium sp. JS66 TaxID=3064705 RepID=UPI00298EB5A7|nr:gallidermin/nisin family lantibiotic [Clostridium sp. JS66]WPC43328.1 gallidermin/nisin family lantibiotic [Clostridium sp. JS66]